MPETSVLIPAKNEVYLGKTIQNVLAAARGDIEIIAVCDGYWPEPEIPDDPRVVLLHYTESIGQRPAVNQAARIARGKYILKLDGHCAVDEGFDVKLAADCEYDWIAVPRMYQINPDTWAPKLTKKTDFMFFRSPEAAEHPFRIDYYDAKCARAFPDEYRAYRKAAWRQGDICDTMTCIGAGWFMHKDRFWELGGMDEAHGHWGQMGVELSCKAWLSGGRMIVNKKTWFAHLWRNHAPWRLTQHQVDTAREHSKDLWLSGTWPLQKRPLSWLIEKFAPVPSWTGYQFKDTTKTKGESMNPQNTGDLTLLYYTANRINETFRDKVIAQLQYACPNAPIISVSQKPMTLGNNIEVGEIGASLQNIYKQVLAGLRMVKTDYVALVEDDCLYVLEHFTYRPQGKIAYNLNRWLLHADSEPSEPHVFSYRKRPILSQCIAPTKLLLECLSQREGMDIPKKYCGEPGLFEGKLGLKEYPYETFETKEPNVVVCHNKNTSGRKYQGKDAEPRSELTPWGNAEQLLIVLGLSQTITTSSDKTQPSTSSKSGEEICQFCGHIENECACDDDFVQSPIKPIETITEGEPDMAKFDRDSIIEWERDYYLWMIHQKAGHGKNHRFPTWMGVPVVKYPNDLLLYQQELHKNRPDILIETGTYQGGSALFFANMFDLIGKGQVVSIDIHDHHGPKHPRITYLVGRSTSSPILETVREMAKGKTVMVVLDSDHRRVHVKRELGYYGKLVTPGQYMVVEDTNYAQIGKRDGPDEAVEWFLKRTKKFKREAVEKQFLLSLCPGGWLRRV